MCWITTGLIECKKRRKIIMRRLNLFYAGYPSFWFRCICGR